MVIFKNRIINVPDVSLNIIVSHLKCVCLDGVTYKNNNAYVVIGYDGLLL